MEEKLQKVRQAKLYYSGLRAKGKAKRWGHSHMLDFQAI